MYRNMKIKIIDGFHEFFAVIYGWTICYSDALNLLEFFKKNDKENEEEIKYKT